MKGIVFTLLNELVEEKFGIAAWDSALNGTEPPLKGIYTAAATYPDEELFALVGQLSKISGIPAGKLVYAFGEYALPKFAEHYPVFFNSVDNAKAFIQSIDSVIHVEVKKLYPQAELPKIEYENPSNHELVMIYQSNRKLCDFAAGLIKATGEYFKTDITHHHTQCMHKGDAQCRFELTFN